MTQPHHLYVIAALNEVAAELRESEAIMRARVDSGTLELNALFTQRNQAIGIGLAAGVVEAKAKAVLDAADNKTEALLAASRQWAHDWLLRHPGWILVACIDGRLRTWTRTNWLEVDPQQPGAITRAHVYVSAKAAQKALARFLADRPHKWDHAALVYDTREIWNADNTLNTDLLVGARGPKVAAAA